MDMHHSEEFRSAQSSEGRNHNMAEGLILTMRRESEPLCQGLSFRSLWAFSALK